MKILIAEDNPKVRNFIRKILTPIYADCEYFEAENGLEAIDTFRNQNPDIILMDIMMDVLDGLTAVRRIRDLSSKVKILIVSQLPESEYRNESIKSGADEYLNKENLVSLPKVIKGLQITKKA